MRESFEASAGWRFIPLPKRFFSDKGELLVSCPNCNSMNLTGAVHWGSDGSSIGDENDPTVVCRNCGSEH